ncbi:MAG: FkbM family methyltransferase [Planctomycetia bacterium]
MPIDVFSNGDLVFDVGANIGNKAAQFLARGARVVCFEPQPACVERLRVRFGGDPRVTIVPKGLADQAGRLTLSICDVDTLSTFSEQWKRGRHASNRWSDSAQVDVITLDSAIADYGRPRYCKIDVEGFEMNVLRGLTQSVDVLSFEFTKEFIENAAAAVSYLNGIGMNEFTVALGENDFFSVDGWVDGHLLVDAIGRHEHRLLWGDLYARSPVRVS